MNTSIQSLEFADKIYVHLKSEDILTIPYSYTEKLQLANKEQLQNYRLIGGGIGIHFEVIDEDISLRGIIDYKLQNELRAS
jgi:hypothetical protein